jgi:hypothetical protein
VDADNNSTFYTSQCRNQYDAAVSDDNDNANLNIESNNDTGNYSSDFGSVLNFSGDDNKSDVNDNSNFHALLQQLRRAPALGRRSVTQPTIDSKMEEEWNNSIFRQQDVTQKIGNGNSQVDHSRADTDCDTQQSDDADDRILRGNRNPATPSQIQGSATTVCSSSPH